MLLKPLETATLWNFWVINYLVDIVSVVNYNVHNFFGSHTNSNGSQQMVELDWLESANKREPITKIKDLAGETVVPNKHQLFQGINTFNDVKYVKWRLLMKRQLLFLYFLVFHGVRLLHCMLCSFSVQRIKLQWNKTSSKPLKIFSKKSP